MAIDTIIFDFDGTIADTNQLVIDSWQHTYKARLGREEDVDKITRSFGEPLVETMKKVLPDFDVEESIAIYRSYQRDVYESRIKAFPGMVDTVKELKSKGYKLGIVTSRLRGSTVTGLEAFGIADCIDVIVTCEDTDKHKPDPEPVLIGLDRLGSKPETAIMIGDSLFDIQCAHNANVKTVLVAWTVTTSPDELKGKDAPDFVVERAEEIIDIVSA